MKRYLLPMLSAALFFGLNLMPAEAVKGKLVKNNIHHAGCDIERIEVRYSLDHFMQEPIVNGIFEWTAASGSPSTKLPHSVVVHLKISPKGPGRSYYFEVAPTVPGSGKGFGMNVSGSPNWDELFFDSNENYLSKEEAKEFYKAGFEITDFILKGGEEEARREAARKAELAARKKAREEQKAREEAQRRERERLVKQREEERQAREAQRKRELARREQERAYREEQTERREEQMRAHQERSRREAERVAEHNQRILDNNNQRAESTQSQIQNIQSTADDIMFNLGY